MYLDQESVETVKRFIRGTGLNLSSYLDLIICEAAENIRTYESLTMDEEFSSNGIFSEKDKQKYFNIYEAHKILGLAGSKDLNFTEKSGVTMSPTQKKNISSGKWQMLMDKSGMLRIVMNPENPKPEKDGEITIYIDEE